MDAADFTAIKGKIIKGVFALTGRTLILQLVAFISTFILTILLSPEIFGVFFVVSAVISFLSYFSDVGLAAALVQKKEEPTRAELVSVFTVQQAIVGMLVVGGILLSSGFANFYGLGDEGAFLLKSLLISFFLASVKTIPSVILERRLEFSLLVLPQLLETFVFYAVAIVLAYFGFGITSFSWASILRGIVGVVSIYLICPWKIGFGLSFSSLRQLMSFGVPFQVNSILALVKDDLMTIFLGKILPFSHLGYLGWAKKWAEAPLRLIMDSIIRVTFPAFSRLQESKDILKKGIAKSLFFLALFIFPSTLLMVIYMEKLIYIIPQYEKWAPALLPFYLYAVSSVMSGFSSPLINALNAIGRIKVTLKLMIFWTLATWIATPILAMKIGYVGASLSSAIIATTAFLPIYIAKKYLPFSFAKSIRKPVLATTVLILVSFPLSQLVGDLASLSVAVASSVVIYLIFSGFFMTEELEPYLPGFVKDYLMKIRL